MGYQSQLVVRTRLPKGGRIIDRVKELADREGKTYSQMALELLEQGIAASEDASQEVTTSNEPHEQATETDAPEPASSGKDRVEAELARIREAAVRRKPKPAPAQTMSDTSTSFRSGETADVVVNRSLTQLTDGGNEAAARILGEFFAAAGPVEGGRVKQQLKDRLSAEAYDGVFEALKKTSGYLSYKNRVISGLSTSSA